MSSLISDHPPKDHLAIFKRTQLLITFSTKKTLRIGNDAEGFTDAMKGKNMALHEYGISFPAAGYIKKSGAAAAYLYIYLRPPSLLPH